MLTVIDRVYICVVCNKLIEGDLAIWVIYWRFRRLGKVKDDDCCWFILFFFVFINLVFIMFVVEIGKSQGTARDS